MVLSINSHANDIVTSLQALKIKAINIVSTQLNDPNSNHLPPRDVKTLTDIVLNLEDSLSLQISEGQQTRKLKRLLDKYSIEGDSTSEDDSTIIDIDYAN